MGNQALNFILGRARNRKHHQNSVMNETPVQINEMHPQQHENILFATLIDEWFFHHKFEIMESTAYGYEKSIPYVKKYFDGIRINDITSNMIYDYISYLKNGPLSIGSTKIYCKIVQLSLRYGIKYKYLLYNPAEDVVIKRPPRVEVKPFSESEFKLLIGAEAPDWVKNGMIIAYRTGMRPGEIYALKWSDINLDQHFIAVQSSISKASSSVTLKTTKTPTGVRRIDIDSKLTALLVELKKNNPNEIFLFPGRSSEGCRVPWNVTKYVKRMCEDVGISPRNFYALRHTHASVLMAHGVHPKIVQERLGHHSSQITMDTYSHVCPTIQKQAVDVMENI